MLADYNDVFADIVNVLLFNGKQIVDESLLENVKDKSQYKADDGKLHEEERDIAKVVKNQKVRLALIGLEHQTDVDADEPFRVIAYDGASYKSQLLSDRKERYPVVTLVLYFGTKRWNKGTTLYEVFDVDEKWKPYINDYKINLFEIAFLTQEQIDMFKSDFKIVADYFVQKRMNKDYRPSKDVIRHVDEVLKLMIVLTGDTRFQDAQSVSKEGSEVTMCEMLDRMISKGEVKGEKKLGLLISALFAAGRVEDARLASEDEEKRKQLYCEMGII